MSWEAAGALGEIVGAVAVVISLIYLATQVRQNTEAARASTRQAIADSTVSVGSDLLHEPHVATAVARELQGEELAFEDYLRLQTRAYMGMRHFENVYYQFRSGLLTQDEWHGFRENLKWLLQLRSYQDFWRAQASHFSPAFQTEVMRVEAESADKAQVFANDPLLNPKTLPAGDA